MNDYYVYIYFDPRTRLPFYIGKGRQKRWEHHLRGYNSSKRVQDKILSIRTAGYEPIVHKCLQSLDERDAYFLEKCLIEEFGRKGLDCGGVLMNLCKDNRPPPNRGPLPQAVKDKISKAHIGKRIGVVPWNKGISFSRGPQKPQQSIKVMKTKLKKLCEKILSRHSVVCNATIAKSRSDGLIYKFAPISEAALEKIFGVSSVRIEDMNHPNFS